MRTLRAPTPVAALLAASLAVSLAMSLAACSGDSSDSGGPSEPGGSQATEEPGPLTTTANLGKVTGKLAQEKRATVRQQVRQAVDAWFDAAYVGGDYPRNDFADSWPGFTAGAAADAKKDKALMSNQDIGTEITGVEATKRKVTVDVLAVKGRPVAATARVVLEFTADGDAPRDVVVRGRLFLTKSPDGWQVFGYDMTKGDQA